MTIIPSEQEPFEAVRITPRLSEDAAEWLLTCIAPRGFGKIQSTVIEKLERQNDHHHHLCHNGRDITEKIYQVWEVPEKYLHHIKEPKELNVSFPCIDDR